MAVAATTVYEIQSGGIASDNNGGGFNSAAAGTDYTYGAGQTVISWLAAGGTYTNNLNITNANPSVVSSVSRNFVAADVGNMIHLTAGTNVVAGWYQISSVNSNNATLDRLAMSGEPSADGSGYLGGPLASIGGLGAVLTTAGGGGGVAGIKAYIKGGTYNLGATAVNTPAGPLDLDETAQDSLQFYLKGYDASSAREAWTGTRPVIDCVDQTPANAHVIELKGTSGVNWQAVAFVEVDGADLTTDGIFGSSSQYTLAISCVAHHCDSGGFSAVRAMSCYSYSNVGNGFSNCNPAACRASTNGQSGFYNNAYYTINCIADGNTQDGFVSTANYLFYISCISCDNGSDGFQSYYAIFYNCISYSNAAYEYNIGTATNTQLFNCASGDVTSGRYPAAYPPWIDVGKVELTGDPFVDRGNATLLSRDFNLIATGGGLQCRAAGLDPYGQTGAIDISAVQHADPAGGGSNQLINGGLIN